MTDTLTPAGRLRDLIAAEFTGPDAPPVHTALLLLNLATGKEEVRLYSQVSGGHPGHERAVFRSEAPHSPFALDLMAALHAYRLHNWHPERDGYLPGAIDPTGRRASGQVGWAIDLRHLAEDA